MDTIGEVDETSWFFQSVVRNRVPLGALLALVFLFLAHPATGWFVTGLWIAFAGEALRTWASGTIVKNKVLATDGPYALTRNPLYAGNFLLGLGVAVMGSRPVLVILFLLFFVPVYRRLVLKEEKRLLESYGEEFTDYCGTVPRFFPDFSSWPPPPAPYDAGRMWRVHKEWKAWLGLFAVTCFLLLKR